MNTTLSMNQTSPLIFSCSDSYPGYFIGLAVIALDFTVLLPIHMWVLWLGASQVRRVGHLAASEIFTINLSALELFAVLLLLFTLVAFALNYQHTMLLALFFSGTYLVGRPFMNSLICVERYMAVAHPVTYRNPNFVKHRYISAGLVWLVTVAYGGLAVSSYPEPPIEVYILSLTISLLVITACSLGVLKVLLRPTPGETQKEGMHSQTKRAFDIVTCILVCLFIAYGLYLLIFIFKKYIIYDTFCLLAGISMWLMQPSSVIQPLLYLSKLRKLPCTKNGS